MLQPELKFRRDKIRSLMALQALTLRSLLVIQI